MAGSNAFTTLIMKGLVYLLLLNTISPVLAAPVDKEAPTVVKRDGLSKRNFPVQPGQPANCNAWTLVRKSDTCDSIVSLAKHYDIVITKTVFLKYNPALKNNCGSIKPSVWVCIQTEKPRTSTKKTTTKKTTTTTTKKPVTTTTTKKPVTTTTTTKKPVTTTTTTKKPVTTTTTSKPPTTTTTTQKTTTTTEEEEETTTTTTQKTTTTTTEEEGETTTTTTQKTTTTTKEEEEEPTTTTTQKTTTTTTEEEEETTTTTTPKTTTTTPKTTTTTTEEEEETTTSTTIRSNSTTTDNGGPSVKTTTSTTKLTTTSEEPEETTTTTKATTTTTTSEEPEESTTTTKATTTTTTSEEPEETTTTTTKATTTTTTSKTTTTTSKTTTSSAKPTQSGYKYAVRGAQNGCANRRDINTLQQDDPDVFNLLMVALNQLHTANSSDPWSYYQLSGIHGIPFQAWPDPKETGDFDKTRGYCPHGSILFATWHRPYMLILEQALVAAGEEIASKYKTAALKTKYEAAAKRLRFPYWDWSTAQFESHTPAIVKQATVSVVTPDGTKSINNPLFAYRFKGEENKPFRAPFVGAKLTTRGTLTFTGSTNEAAADAAMQAGFITRRQQTYNNLMSTTSFNDFCSSLEVIHNQVHVEIGGEGGGSMYYLAYSAFDPIFWLHHNNIDRLMAIWQAANPDLRLARGRAVGTFQRRVQAGITQDDENTPLYPFKHPDGSWWTSKDVADVRAIWDYGYGFPEVPCDRTEDTKDELDLFSTTQINALYKPPSLAAAKRAETESRSEWNVNIVVDQAEMSETFSIYVFLGKVPTDPAEWIKADTKLGTLSVLGNPDMQRVSNIQTAIIPITALLKEKQVEGTEEEINEYLKKNLAWRAMSGGKEIDVTKLKTLKVGVTVNTITISTDESVKAEFSDPVLVTKITEDKKAGVTTLEEIAKPVDKTGVKAVPVARLAHAIEGETSDAADNAAKVHNPPADGSTKSDDKDEEKTGKDEEKTDKDEEKPSSSTGSKPTLPKPDDDEEATPVKSTVKDTPTPIKAPQKEDTPKDDAPIATDPIPKKPTKVEEPAAEEDDNSGGYGYGGDDSEDDGYGGGGGSGYSYFF
ncbi:hypothetical protein TWF281_007471 [Arthrobotrys megalospora]